MTSRIPSGTATYLRTPLGIALVAFLLLGVCLLVACFALRLHTVHLAMVLPFALMVIFPAVALALYARQSTRAAR